MSDLLSPEEIRSCPVLCVDDDEENLLGFQMSLRRQFRILVARSAAEALEIMASEPVGVLVTDQRMPEMTGVQLIQRAKDLYPETVFLIITAYSDFDAIVEGVNTGALSGYIAKPWEAAEVELIIRGAVERHLLSKQLRARNSELADLNRALECRVEERTVALQETVGQLNTANAQLAELNRLKDDFLSFCSHDLRSPLSALTGFIDLVESRMSRLEGFEVFSKTLLSMREVVTEMSSLVDHILDLSRLESGRETIRPTLAPLQETVARALSTARTLADQKGIAVNLEVEEGLREHPHDVDRIAQVVSNLLSNAIKFTEPGGKVALSVRGGANGEQIVEVTDNGIGMSPEVCQHILTEGQRFRRPGTEGERSTGLGLGICRRIVNLHGGDIRVRSAPGEGSVFTFTLGGDPDGADQRDTDREALPSDRSSQ